MSTYVVQENEWLIKIAQDHGFRSEQPLVDANATLRERYSVNTNVLPPGLEIEIPDKEQKFESAQTGQVAEFVARNTQSNLTFTLQNPEGNPLANWSCDLQIGDKVWSNLTADANGVITVKKIPRDGTVGSLRLIAPASSNDSAAPINVELEIGGIDPIDEGSVGCKSVQKILHNLAYYDGPIDGDMQDDTETAVQWFQEDEELGGTDGPDGDADRETCNKLIEVQGVVMPPPIPPWQGA